MYGFDRRQFHRGKAPLNTHDAIYKRYYIDEAGQYCVFFIDRDQLARWAYGPCANMAINPARASMVTQDSTLTGKWIRATPKTPRPALPITVHCGEMNDHAEMVYLFKIVCSVPLWAT